MFFFFLLWAWRGAGGWGSHGAAERAAQTAHARARGKLVEGAVEVVRFLGEGKYEGLESRSLGRVPRREPRVALDIRGPRPRARGRRERRRREEREREAMRARARHED